MNKADLFSIRPGTPDDTNFIYATWLRSLFYDENWFSDIPKDIFMANYHNVVQSILSRPLTTISVACLKDDPEVILGYSVSAPNVLHWVYVKTPWRKIGIAKSLVPDGTSSTTHLTRVGLSILRKTKGVIFNPFLIP